MELCNHKHSWKGRCCCNCKFQCQIVEHVANSDHFSHWGCSMMHVVHQIYKQEGMSDPEDVGVVVKMKDEHGICEMHEWRNNVS